MSRRRLAEDTSRGDENPASIDRPPGSSLHHRLWASGWHHMRWAYLTSALIGTGSEIVQEPTTPGLPFSTSTIR